MASVSCGATNCGSVYLQLKYTYTRESKDATSDATPATIIVALASLDPVPPKYVSTGVVAIFPFT